MTNKELVVITVVVQMLVSCASQVSVRTERDHMNQMADVLNNSIEKEYLDTHLKNGFYVKSHVPINFFIYDLVDTTNNTYLPKINVAQKVRLQSEGIYHFAPWDLRVSFSHIAVINDKEIKIFRLLNCNGKGDNIEKVIEYVRNYHSYEPSVLKRIINYRQHGVYAATDDMSYVDCKLALNQLHK